MPLPTVRGLFKDFMCKPIENNLKDNIVIKSNAIKTPGHLKEKKRILKIKKSLENLLTLIDEKIECTELNEKILQLQDDLTKTSESVMKTHFRSCISQALRNKDKVFIEAQLEKLTQKS